MQSLSPNLPPDVQREMLRRMLTIRRFEERASADYLAGKIYGVVHCYIGEEAVAVGVCSALGQGDRIISTHRGHGHCIAKGADLNRMMAELYGRQTGYCKGKGGSMHIADFGDRHARRQRHRRRRHRDRHRRGSRGADGKARAASRSRFSAMAHRMPGRSTNASTSRRPGNCRCSMSARTTCTPRTPRPPRRMPSRDVAARAAGYGIPGVVVDGNDIFAVYQAANRAVERARAGEGPSLIECKTYRWRGHTERRGQADVRDPAEVEAWKRRDPIAQLERQLAGAGRPRRCRAAGDGARHQGRARGRRRLCRGEPLPAARAGDRRRVCGVMRWPPNHSSFRGAAQGREPGTHFPKPVVMGSGLAAARRPGMTICCAKRP